VLFAPNLAQQTAYEVLLVLAVLVMPSGAARVVGFCVAGAV
jgi:hypothetical protein